MLLVVVFALFAFAIDRVVILDVILLFFLGFIDVVLVVVDLLVLAAANLRFVDRKLFCKVDGGCLEELVFVGSFRTSPGGALLVVLLILIWKGFLVVCCGCGLCFWNNWNLGIINSLISVLLLLFLRLLFLCVFCFVYLFLISLFLFVL